MRPEICTASPAHVPRLAAILSDWIDTTSWMPRLGSRVEDQAFVAGLVSGPGARIALVEGVPVGFLAREGAEIVALYVDAGWRGFGLGSALVAEAQGRLGRLTIWCPEPDARLARFCARAGFAAPEPAEIRQGAAGLPELRLEWRASA